MSRFVSHEPVVLDFKSVGSKTAFSFLIANQEEQEIVQELPDYYLAVRA